MNIFNAPNLTYKALSAYKNPWCNQLKRALQRPLHNNLSQKKHNITLQYTNTSTKIKALYNTYIPNMQTPTLALYNTNIPTRRTHSACKFWKGWVKKSR